MAVYDQAGLGTSGATLILLVTCRRAFIAQPLIYIPPSSRCSLSGWFRAEECRWSGADCLRKTPQLSYIYPHLSEFFCTTLLLQDADLLCITAEVLKVSPSDGLT